MTTAFRIHRDDNVATLLAQTPPGTVYVIGERTAEMTAIETIAAAPYNKGLIILIKGQ